MKELVGDLWEAHALGHWVAITTNGMVGKDGAVMGRGVAKQAVERMGRALARALGDQINRHGNRVYAFPRYRILSFPVKHHWREMADLDLIEQSARSLAGAWLKQVVRYPVYLVRPGCGNGGLRWDDVKLVIAPFLDDRFIVVNKVAQAG